MRATLLLACLLLGACGGGGSPAPTSSAVAAPVASATPAPVTSGPAAAAAPATPPPLVVRAVTFNLWTSFFSPAPDPRWEARRDHAIAELRRLGPLDLVALQEVSRCDLGAPPLLQRENTAVSVGRALGLAVAFTPTWPMLPIYEEGNAVASRWPIRREADLWLSSSPPHPRRALLAEVATPAGPLRVACVHLSGSEAHAREVAAWLAAQRPAMPALFLGDVNAEPHEPAAAALRAAGWIDAWEAATGSPAGGATSDPRNAHHAPTDPARRIDYVFVDPGPRAVTVRSARVVLDAPDATGRPASDHYGVLVELEVR